MSFRFDPGTAVTVGGVVLSIAVAWGHQVATNIDQSTMISANQTNIAGLDSRLRKIEESEANVSGKLDDMNQTLTELVQYLTKSDK